MKPKNNTLVMLAAVVFAAAISLLGAASTNGFISSVSAQHDLQFIAKLSGQQ